MASEALKRAMQMHRQAGNAVWPHEIRDLFDAALDPTDEALVEAVASAMYGGSWQHLIESHKAEYRAMARAAIAALRDHICGEGA